MKRRLLAIAMTLAMALSLLPVTALADGPEDQTPPSVTVTDESDQTDPTNGTSDEETTTPTDEEPATDTETPVEDPEQGTEPEASADETGTATTTEETGQDDGITTEKELIDAISSAEAGDTITLAGDITLTSQLTIDNGKEIVLDLYGHTLNAGSNTISVTGESSLTIETSSGKGKITAEKQIEVDSASLTLNSGEIEITGISDKSYGIYVLNNGFVTVNNGTINSNYAALAGNNTTGDMNFEVNGGQLSAKNGPAIYMPGQVQLLITNGTIDGGISLRMGQVKISGGTINAVTANIDSPEKHYNYSGNAWLPDALYVFNGTYESDNGKYGNSLNLEITGGTFNCTNDQGSAVAIYDIGRVAQKSAVTISGKAVMTNSAEGRSAYQVLSLGDIGVENPASGYGKYVGDIESSITGGTFSTDVSAYVADGHICEKSDNNYVVSELNADNSVAQVGDDYYATLAEALEDAQDNETVKLLKDTVITPVGTESNNLIPQITISSDVTIDLNGKQVTTAGSAIGYTPVLFNIDGATVTITGNGTIDVQTVGAYDDGEGCYGINITNNGSLTIENGTFTGAPTAVQVTAGTLTILGGTFRLVNIEMDEEDLLYMSKFVVNCIDSNFANGTARIYIKGGSFCFDPDGKPEASDITYVPAGYESVQTENGMWTVGPKTDGMEASADADGNTASATVGGNFTTNQTGEDGVSTDNTTIQIDVTTGEGEGPSPATGVTTTNVNIAPESLTSVQAATGIENVEIATDVGTLTVDKTAWNTITDNAKGESVTLSISQVQTADGNKPLVYELTAKAGETDVFAQGSSGTITVDVPYTGTTAHVYYVGDDGAEQMTDAEAKDGRLTWSVSHFSTYVVTQTETGTFAVTTEDGDTTITSYETLDAALDALTSNADDTVTITLLEDATLSESYTVKSNLTIQGNVTITLNVPNNEQTSQTLVGITVTNGGSLTLDNGVILDIEGTKQISESGGTSTTKYYGTGIDVNFGGKLTVQNGATVKLNNLNRGTISSKPDKSPDTAGQFTLNGATMTVTNIGGNFSNGGDWTIDDSTLTMNGVGNYGLSAGTITTTGSSQITATGVAYSAIYGHNEINIGGTTEVNVTDCGSGLPYRSEGNYGDATAPIQLKVVRDNKDDTETGTKPNSDAKVVIAEGAKVTVENCVTDDGTANNTIYVPAGATYTNNGTVTGTVTSSGEAMVDGKVYETLAAALTAASSATDKTVTLLGDVETSTAISIPEGVTLDGNDHSITYTGTPASTPQNGAFITVNTGADDVTIQDVTINAGTNFKHGVQFYCNDGGTLDNVKIIGGAWTSVLVNGATNVTIEETTLTPGADAYANIEYAMGDGVNTADQIPSLTVDNVTFGSAGSQIWVDDATVANMKTALNTSDNNTVVNKVNNSITNNNSGDITVSIELTDGNVTNSTIDGTDDDDHGGSSGGGSSVTRYTVSVPSDIEGGSVRVSPSRASRGQTVTITVDPDEGYVLDRLVVRDSDGDRIDLERKSDTKYTFEMPRGKVTVEATFTEIEEEDAIPFRDVDTDDWFYDAVVYAYDNDLMSGVSDDQFAPDATLTRAMVAQMLYSLEGKPRTGSAGYADVAFGAWYEDAVAWISSEGLMTGYSDAAFGPNDPLTREQLALILYNYADWAGYDVRGSVSLGSYIDADSASTWAVEALEWAIDAGLISGRGEGILAPAGTATRAEVAQIFMNFLENVAQ